MRHATLRTLRGIPLALLLSTATLAAATSGCSRPGSGTDPSLTAAQVGAVNAKVGEPFDLKFGQSAEVAGTNLRFTFSRVAGDSRCPTDVVCIWEGDGEIAVRVDRGGTPVGTVELHTSPGRGGLREVD